MPARFEPPTNVTIPQGSSTITFTFHQSYDRSDGSERIQINLATNGCQADPILAEAELPPTPPAFESASFEYDGDGKRVKSTVNGTTTTYFIGNYYEVTNPGANETITKYYYAGGQRIAMRTDGDFRFLLGDHLGSTSLVVRGGGYYPLETRYTAWGEVRYTNGSMQTKYQFTGQYSQEAEFGLLFYQARWYDSSLGRFAQADTIVPDGVQGYDRYAYVSNNPLRYTDPTGHMETEGCGDGKDACAASPEEIIGNAQILVGLQQESDDHKCAEGNEAYCTTAIEHPVEVMGFTGTMLIGGPALESFLLGGGAAGLADAAYIAMKPALMPFYAWLARFFTRNPGAQTVSLGSFDPARLNGYIEVAKGNSYTYYAMNPMVYRILNAVGLANPINEGFMINQMAQGKDFVVTVLGDFAGPGTLMEMEMLAADGYSRMISSGFSNFYSIFSHLTFQ